jgi:hypothetical protein
MIDIGSRRELFVDDSLIEQFDGARLELHRPVPRDIAIAHTEPWEGNTSYYHTVMRDGNLLRMYYRGSHFDEARRRMCHEVVCYAESHDGLVWAKPDLGIVSFAGSKHNNIVWAGETGSHNFTPVRDWNPECPAGERYKAVGRRGTEGLFAFVSRDGIEWRQMQESPIITKGAFDSQNVAFWDSHRGCYVDYHRDFRDGVRDIVTATSPDFRVWSEPVWLDYGDAPVEQLYTNQIEPYFRAPHIYLGFPKRFVPGRNPERHAQDGVSDVVFMTSRDGTHFHRWTEAFIRPGLQHERWVNRNNFVAWGIVETASPVAGVPSELTFYSGERYYRGIGTVMRRYTLRRDGFVSVSAPLSGGEIVTRPFRFQGSALELNFSTSAAGSIGIELLDESMRRIDSMAFEPVYGDSVDRVIQPTLGSLSAVSTQPVRLRVCLADADLFSLRFCE